jgi:thiosulfate/3-mercaptopyruvate sulfurtransferase
MLVANLIDARSLARCLGTCVLLDCRFDLTDPDAGRKAYRDGHIPGARYVDLNRDLAGPITVDSGRHPLPSPAALARRFGELGISAGVQVVVYDAANGSFAARAWWLLRWIGHARVTVLDGGFAGWVAAGGAIESGDDTGSAGPLSAEPPAAGPPAAGQPRSEALTPTVDATAVVSTSELRDALRDPGRRLIDARAAERYAGTVEPIDPVAGHVPGAVNHPFTGNLAPDGRFLPADELRDRWLKSLGGAAPSDLILMCGSGVTACHNLLAMELAGLPGAKLYAGSWSEWIRDPAHPVARGPAP